MKKLRLDLTKWPSSGDATREWGSLEHVVWVVEEWELVAEVTLVVELS